MKNFRNILNWVLICFLITQVGNIWAIPADPTPFKLQQPDGKEFHAKLHGDEFLHFITTTDGYTIIKSPDGFTNMQYKIMMKYPSRKIYSERSD